MSNEIVFKGKTVEELKSMSMNDFAKIAGTRARRSLKRGFTEHQKRLLDRLEETKKGNKKPIKTHCRDQIVLPQMLGLIIQVYSGKAFTPVEIQPEMLGRYLGEFSQTRSKVAHSAPGLGATKSSGAKTKK